MNEKEIPSFFATKALASEGPFLLLSQDGHYQINLKRIPEDKWHIFHNILLNDSAIKWTISDNNYLRFIINILRDHNHLQKLDIWIEYNLNSWEMEELITAIKSTSIRDIGLIKGDNSETDMSPIIKATEQMSSLQKILIYLTPTIDECEALACALKNPQLHAFEAHDEGLPQGHWDWRLLTESLLSNQAAIKELDLDPLQHDDFEHIGKFLRNSESLETLNLCLINPEQVLTPDEIETHIISNLTHNNSLKELTLTPFRGDAQVRPFFKALAHNRLKISTLFVRSVGTSKKLEKDTTAALFDSLKINTSLTKLKLSDFRIDECADFAEALKHNSTLKSIHLKCSEDMDEVKVLCNVLKFNLTSLTELYFNDYDLKREHFELIADMMKYNTTLNKLCLITAKGSDIMAVIEAMRYNKTILYLDLRLWNIRDHLCDPNLKLITDMLKVNRTLRRLKVTCNDAHAMEVLCNELKHNTTICHFQFDYDVKVYHYKLLLELLTHNFALTSVKPLSEQMSKVSLLLTRNRRLKSETQFKVAILSHNVAQRHEALTMLPREVWVKIFCHVTHPGMNSFDKLVNGIFNSYMNE